MVIIPHPLTQPFSGLLETSKLRPDQKLLIGLVKDKLSFRENDIFNGLS